MHFLPPTTLALFISTCTSALSLVLPCLCCRIATFLGALPHRLSMGGISSFTNRNHWVSRDQVGDLIIKALPHSTSSGQILHRVTLMKKYKKMIKIAFCHVVRMLQVLVYCYLCQQISYVLKEKYRCNTL